MSGVKKIQCELPQKPWNDYSCTEIRRYCLRNMRNTDCSFIAEGEKDNKDRKVYKSFKWILCEMSPVLKEILNDVKNQAKDCKEIVVSNPKYIEAILFFGHFKVLDREIINLVDFYECSKQYQVKILEDKVIKLFESVENQKNQDWFKLFWLSYVKYPEDQQMRAIFEKVQGHLTYGVEVVEANLDLILEFDEELFDIFFYIMVGRSMRLRFKITEAYLIKHFLDGNKNKKLEEIDLLQRNFIEWYMNKSGLCASLDWYTYKNGPLLSNLLTTKRKIEHLQIISKGCKYPETTEIWNCQQKLREAESNLKTENKP